MNKRLFVRTLSAMLCAAALTPANLAAKTVAWYRFEEVAPGGAITSATVFTNTMDATKFPAYAGVCNFGGNSRYSKANLAYTAEYMPSGTNAFPSTIALLNAQDMKRETANNGAVALNMGKIDNANSSHAQVFVDDDEDLRLQTFTLEFFARIPDTATGFRSLVTRCGSAYADGNTSFILYGQLLGNGNMYSICKFTVTDGETTTTKQLTMSGKSDLDNNRWHHFAIVADGTSKKFTVYIDYAQAGQATYDGDIFYEPGYPLAFGGHPQCTYFNSALLLDEVRISDEALAPAQMLKYKAAAPSSVSAVVDDDTLFYFPFEGSTEPVTVGADDMQTPVTYVPYLKNKAVNPTFSSTDAALYRKSNATEIAPTVLCADVPIAGGRFGLRGLASFNDEQAFHCLTNSLSNDYCSPIMVDTGSTQTDLFSTNCTVEFFFKAPSKGFNARPSVGSGSIHIAALVNAFDLKTTESTGWNGQKLLASIGSTELQSSWAAHPTYTSTSYIDGKWHHCAFVYDKDNARADLYIDKSPVMSAENVPAPSLARHNSYPNGLLIGGSFWTDRWFGDLRIDEVRISRGALRPYQFLTTVAAEEDLLARASFENDLVLTPYTNYFGEAGVASAFASGGAAPVFSADVPARVLTAGKGGETVVDGNTRSLSFNGGKATWPGRSLMADAEEFTVEFFMKSSMAVPGAGVMRVNRGSESDLTSAVTWAVSFADASGNLRLKIDTDAATGQTHDFAASFADGAWHHVALQFAVNGGNTAIALFKDATQVGAWTANGKILARPRELNFMIGAGEDDTAAFRGNIDELRVSPGIVSPSLFLTPQRNGTVVTFR